MKKINFFVKKLYDGILNMKEDCMEIIGIGIENRFLL